jgi:DNA-binding HxlR family transcriptional regulator
VSPEVKPIPTLVDGVRICPIANTLEVVGDKWSLLVLRELSLGVHRFNDIQRQTGAPRDRIADRLRSLEQSGLIERRQYSEHPPRFEYWLTEAGSDLTPVLDSLRQWGERYRPAIAR